MNKTRHSLALSLISLLLCFSMLLGTTWAWFTDSVTSANNRIQTGTLDVELEYYVDGDWEKVTETTNVFEKDALWEPGHTEVVYLKISNLGSLALKYDFSINVVKETVGTNAAGEKFLLSDHIRYGVDHGKTPEYTGREEAVDAVSASSTPLKTAYSKKASMKSGDPEAYVALVVYMPESVGNEANAMKGTDAPVINLGISVMATQYTVEDDSFGTDYDKGAFFPDSDVDVSVTAPVKTDADNKVTEAVDLGSSDNVSAVVSKDTLLEAGTDFLTLSVTELETTNGNITVDDGEETRSVDVHVDGIAEGNTVPVIVSVKKLMPAGLNMGNYTLYHVEKGTPVAMTYVTATPVNHNEFTYDPATGDVVIALCSFSEVAVVAETAAAWEGNYNYDWYGERDKAEYIIANADQLAGFGKIVGGMAEGIEIDAFAGSTVKLVADVNLGDAEDNNDTEKIFYPIGYYNSSESYDKVSGVSVTSGVSSFEGTFDGNGHKISNFYQNTWEMFGDYNDGYSGTPNHYKDAMGLFGYVLNGTVKNLTVDNFSSDGEFTPTGVIAAYACNSTFENIAITNCNPRVYNTGNGGIVGIGGNSDDPDTYKLNFTNITIDNTNKITALWGSWDVACGGLVGMFRGAGHVWMTKCHVAAQIDAYNDVCGNYQYYWYRYSGMLVGTNKNMTTDDKGYTVPETDKFHAENCTVHFDKWNDYYYCELVANSLASYTHDHQFSRLQQVDSVDVENMTYTVGEETVAIPVSGRVNLVTLKDGYETENATCYHFVNGDVWNHEDGGEETVNGETVLKEDKQHIYLPFNQLFTGYGWGVKHIPVGEFDGVTIVNRDTQEKFVAKYDTADYRIFDGGSICVEEIFTAVTGAEINGSGVWVTVEAADKNSTVTGGFIPNTDDWSKGLVSFVGTGYAKITIQDYNYCKPTTIIVEVGDSLSLEADDLNYRIIGLDENESYEYTTASILGFGEWIDVAEGSTSIDNLETNLYAVRIKADGNHPASTVQYVYIGDRNIDRDVLWNVRDDGKKVIETTYIHGKRNQPFDIGYWSTSYVMQTNSAETIGGSYISTDFVGVLVYNNLVLGETNEAAFKQLLSLNTTYAMKPEQIVSVDELNHIKLAYNFTGNIGSAVLEGCSYDDYTGLVRIYVAGSDVGYYDIEHKLSSKDKGGELINFKSALPENAHGYVTAIQFFPFAFIPEGANVQDANKDSDPAAKWGQRAIYVFLDIFDYSVKTIYQIGDFETEGHLDGYRITGLEADKTYAYSIDNITWTEVPSGSSYIYLEGVDTCYIKVLGGEYGYDSAVKTVVIGEAQPAVTDLAYADGRITGLDATETYEYAVLRYGDLKWTEITGVTELEATDSGVYAVRLAGDENTSAGAAQYIVVEGEKYGTIAWGKYDRNDRGFVQGYWTSSSPAIYADVINDQQLYGSGDTRYGVRMASSTLLTYENRRNLYYRYALEDEEVFPVKNLSKLKITFGYGNGKDWPNATHYDVLTRVYVAEGEQHHYDIITRYSNTTWTLVNIDSSTAIPSDASGYVTAIEFIPWYNIIGSTVNKGGTGYPVFRLWYYNTVPSVEYHKSSDETEDTASRNAVKAATEKWRCRISTFTAPEIDLVLPDDADYVKGYKITGLDANVIYEYSFNGLADVKLEAGTTEIPCTMPGEYKIRVAETDTYASSAYTTVIVPFVNPVFGGKAYYDANKNYKIQETGFIPGKWTTYPRSWGADSVPENVSHLVSDTVLSTVSYRYEFLESDYFLVNDHPYLSVDMKNQLTNMDITKGYIEGALREINIYVVGEDAPYTYTQEWGVATNRGTTNYTDSKILVNLLDEFPKIEGKTIRAFELKPYSNIDLTPNDYNTSAEANRYMYFHMYYFGFFDTPANTDAVMLIRSTSTVPSGERVNYLTGIRAECSAAFNVGDTPEVNDFTVYEVYSDSKEHEITNFDIALSEGFAETAGTYTVTVTSPRGNVTTVDVTVEG